MFDSRSRRHRALLVLALVSASVVAGAQTVEPVPVDDPTEGDYTVGLYGDREGTLETIRLGKDDTSFTLYLGLTGDPIRNLSATALRIELPDFLELAGPIIYQPIEGLQEKERIFEDGGQIVFANCAAQIGNAPLMLGHFDVKVDPRFREATLEPKPHVRYGLGVQLCEIDGVWPKREAEAVGIDVVRTTSFWDRITSWFD